jgi:hypothetical protein
VSNPANELDGPGPFGPARLNFGRFSRCGKTITRKQFRNRPCTRLITAAVLPRSADEFCRVGGGVCWSTGGAQSVVIVSQL